MPANFKECPVCTVTWEGEEIPDGLMAANPERYNTREAAEEAAEMYGWSPENRLRFGANVIGVEYAHDHPERYDGVSEWRCTVCGARIGRWTEKVLADDESEKRYGAVA